MTGVDRRAFLWSGVAGTTALAFNGGAALAREREPEFTRERGVREYRESLIIEPGFVTRATEGVRPERSPWAFPGEAVDAVPLLMEPFTPDFVDVEAWGSANSEALRGVGPGMTGSVLDAIAAYPLFGASVPPDVTLRATEVLTSDDDASLFSLDFLSQTDRRPSRIISSDGLPLVITTDHQDIATNNYRTVAQLYGWRLQYRPPHVHSLGSCERSPVKHIHLEVMRQNPKNPARWPNVFTVHLGVYRTGGRKCLVLWNSPRPNICWKVCSPTWNDLQRMLAYIIVTAAAIAGVVLAGWAVAAIASAGATALYVPVLIAL